MKWNKKEGINRLDLLKKELGRRPVKRDSPALYSLSRRYFGSWNNMMIKAGYKCKKFQKPIIHNKITGDMYYFLGLLSTDGHIQALKKMHKYRVMLYTSEKEEVKIILKLIKRLFHYDASIRARKTGFSSRPNYEIYISSKKIACYLNRLGIPFGPKSFIMKVPQLVVGTRAKNFWHYFRGVFDGDGSIIFSGYTQILKISSGSERFISGLRKRLLELGVSSFKMSKDQRGLWELKVSRKDVIKIIFRSMYHKAKYYYPRKKLKWEKQYI